MFVPFLSVSSRLADGSYEALSRRNPYLHIGHAGPTGTITDARIGFSGNIADIFTYRLSGGMTWLRDYQIFVAEYDIGLSLSGTTPGDYHATYSPVMFAPVGTDGMLYTFGMELGLLPVGGFSASVGANWNRFGLPGDLPGDLPKYDVSLSLSYSYRGLFSVTAGTYLMGERTFLNRYDIVPPDGTTAANSVSGSSVDTLDPAVNVTLKAEVKAMERFWVFVEGNNLANQTLYSINHYRSTHASVMAGVKVVF
jgi:hypothetical protein